MTAAHRVVLCSPVRDPLMHRIALGIEQHDISVLVVELDPAEADDAVHEAHYLRALADISGQPILGGFSLGARIAAKLSTKITPRGLLCFGYPFHVAKEPGQRPGLDVLSRVTASTRIIQGTRDHHGTEAEVRGYRLLRHVEMVWLRDGNHRFLPRARSGLTLEKHVETAAASAISFIRSLSCHPHRP